MYFLHGIVRKKCLIHVTYLFDKSQPDRFPHPYGALLRATEQGFCLPSPCNFFESKFKTVPSVQYVTSTHATKRKWSTHFSKCTTLKRIRHSEKGEKLTGIYGTVEGTTGQSKYFYMERTIDNYNVEICPLWKNT